MYGRSSGSDRWPGSGSENVLSSLSMRPELPWTPALHSSHPSIARRKDTNYLSSTDSWSGLNTSSSRPWLGSHDASHTSPHLEQRPRVRPGHPYEEAANIRRDPENLSPSYGHRYAVHSSNGRDSTVHRGLPWPHHRDVASDMKDNRSHANHQYHDTSFSPSPPLPFASSGYNQQQQQQHHNPTPHSYNSSWSSTDTSAMEAPAALQVLSPQSNLAYNTTSYASNSASMTGSGEFAPGDDM